MLKWIGELFALASQVNACCKTRIVKLEFYSDRYLVTVNDGRLLTEPKRFILMKSEYPDEETQQRYDEAIKYMKSLVVK